MKGNNIVWHEGKVTYEDRCKNLNQKGVVVWFTGLYEKVKSGEIDDFTGISSPYAEPENPDVVMNTAELTIEESVGKVLEVVNSE